jgi:adenine-specific DNA-methyltransferase
LEWIFSCVRGLPFETVLDGFGGTGSVSLLFKAMGRQVTFHDGLLCNTIAANVLLGARVTEQDKNALDLFVDSIKPTRGFVSSTFSGMYYRHNENRWLDGAATAIHQIDDIGRRDLFLYCLFQACLKKRPFNLFHRANLNLRLNSDVTRSFGNWVTWERSFANLMKEAFVDLSSLLHSNSGSATVLRHGDIARLKGQYDLVYLDPPYVNKEKVTDDYIQRYHFLEGLSAYAAWEKSLNASSPLKSVQTYPYIRDWQDRRQFTDLLFGLIEKHKRSIVVLSYVAGALPSEYEITSQMKSIFSSVRVHRKRLGHALAKTKRTELLFIGRNA